MSAWPAGTSCLPITGKRIAAEKLFDFVPAPSRLPAAVANRRRLLMRRAYAHARVMKQTCVLASASAMLAGHAGARPACDHSPRPRTINRGPAVGLAEQRCFAREFVVESEDDGSAQSALWRRQTPCRPPDGCTDGDLSNRQRHLPAMSVRTQSVHVVTATPASLGCAIHSPAARRHRT